MNNQLFWQQHYKVEEKYYPEEETLYLEASAFSFKILEGTKLDLSYEVEFRNDGECRLYFGDGNNLDYLIGIYPDFETANAQAHLHYQKLLNEIA